MKKYVYSFGFALCSLFVSVKAAAQEDVHRVVILGGGIGGLTSALYAARAGMTPLVIEGSAPGGAIVQSHNVQNWPGELDITGWELMEKVHKQAEASGTLFLKDEVVGVDFSAQPFIITTRDVENPEKMQQIRASSCIIALGSTPKFLGVPGERGEAGYWLRGVYNCAVCDGALFRNKTVAVVGGGDGAINEAHYLSQPNMAKKVYIIVRKNAFRTVEEHRKREVLSRPNVEVVYNTTIQEIKGDGESVTQLILRNESDHKTEMCAVDGLFLAIGSKPNTQIFQGQMELDKLGYIALKGDVQTSVPGVFAIGDIADPIYRQAISASADGMKASYQVEKYLASISAPPAEKIAVAAPIVESHPQTVKKPVLSDAVEIDSIEQFDRELKTGSRPTLVEFYATWCPPCKMVAPLFSSTAKDMNERVNFLKVNVDAFPMLSQRYRITAMPSMLIFDRQGTLLTRKVGSKDIISYLRALEGMHGGSAAQLDSFFKPKS